MSKSNLDISIRLLCLNASVDEKKIENRTLSEEDWGRLTRTTGKLINNASNAEARKFWGDVFNNIFNLTYGGQCAVN